MRATARTANPYSKGTARVNTDYAIGDTYTYRKIDKLNDSSFALRRARGASMFTLIRSIQTPNAEDAEDAVDAEARSRKPIIRCQQVPAFEFRAPPRPLRPLR